MLGAKCGLEVRARDRDETGPMVHGMVGMGPGPGLQWESGQQARDRGFADEVAWAELGGVELSGPDVAADGLDAGAQASGEEAGDFGRRVVIMAANVDRHGRVRLC